MNKKERIVLKQRLAVTEAELINLQQSRTFRSLQKIKSISSLKIKDIPDYIRDLVTVLEKRPLVTPSLNQDDESFHELFNEDPLFTWPNITVYLFSKDKWINEAVSTCFNVIENNQPSSVLYKNLSAITYIICDVKSYTENKAIIDTILITTAPAPKLVIYYKKNKPSNIPKNTIPIQLSPSSLTLPTFNPRNISQKCSINTPSDTPATIEKLSNIHQIESMKLDILYTADSDFFDSLSFNDACKFVKKIACGFAVAANTQPSWLHSPLMKIPKSISEIDIERYRLRIAQEVVLNHSHPSHFSSLFHLRKPPTTISAILCSKRLENISSSLKQLNRQSLPLHEIILGLHGYKKSDLPKSLLDEIKESSVPVLIVEIDESVIFGEALNLCLDQCTGRYVTKIDDDDKYAYNHIMDLLSALYISGATFAGKWNNWTHIKQEGLIYNWMPDKACVFTKHLPGGTFLVNTHTIKQLRFGVVHHAIDTELFLRAIARGATLYSTHRYNYLRVRSNNGHTYIASDITFKEASSKVTIEAKNYNKTTTSE